jgi:hypothetical protein
MAAAMKCANCGTPWKPHYIRCPRCGGTQRTSARNVVEGESSDDQDDMPSVPFIQRDLDDDEAYYSWDMPPQQVVVVNFRLSWGAAFDLVIKIWVAIIVINFLIFCAFLIGSILAGASLIDIVS